LLPLELCTHRDVLKLALQGGQLTLTVANAIDVDSNGTQALSTFSIITEACVERWNLRRSARFGSGRRLPDSFLECDVYYSVEFYMRQFLPQLSTSGWGGRRE
jgi:hypothetical protein